MRVSPFQLKPLCSFELALLSSAFCCLFWSESFQVQIFLSDLQTDREKHLTKQIRMSMFKHYFNIESMIISIISSYYISKVPKMM